MKSKNTAKYVKLIFFGFGSIWIAFGAFFYIYIQSFASKASRTTGTVVKLEKVRSYSTTASSSGFHTVYYPVIQYQTQYGKNVTFTAHSGSNPSPYKRGDQVTILYDLENPQKARIMSFTSLWLAPVSGFGIGSILFFIGTVILTWKRHSRRKAEWFKHNGMPIMAEIEKISVNKKITVNGKNLFKIYAKCLNPKTNEMEIYKSKNLWLGPNRDLSEKERTCVEVWVDPQDYKKYLMNTDSLKEVIS